MPNVFYTLSIVDLKNLLKNLFKAWFKFTAATSDWVKFLLNVSPR